MEINLNPNCTEGWTAKHHRVVASGSGTQPVGMETFLAQHVFAHRESHHPRMSASPMDLQAHNSPPESGSPLHSDPLAGVMSQRGSPHVSSQQNAGHLVLQHHDCLHDPHHDGSPHSLQHGGLHGESLSQPTHLLKSEDLGWGDVSNGSQPSDELCERTSGVLDAAAMAAAVAAHHGDPTRHHMSPDFGANMLEIAAAAGVTDPQQAAALYGHVQIHPNVVAHYMSQAASQRGQMGSPYGHQVSPSSGSSEIRNYTVSPEMMSPQKAVAFLAGPRERIHVFGSPVECCPRCLQEGVGNVHWRPHRHIGELKIRYICERHFEDLESNHHFDIPLCPVCGQVLYLYDFNGMLGVSSARRLHKYVLKCATQHVLPIIDLFCQTKRGGERCNSNFKLQWSYGTMVKRCESQKNRDHDLWWVRYKNEWKQRRTIIRYKKDFLRHLSDVQRAMLLGLGVEGEAPPDPKATLGPTYDALVASAGGTPTGPKMKKRQSDGTGLSMGADDFDLSDPVTSIKRSQPDPHSALDSRYHHIPTGHQNNSAGSPSAVVSAYHTLIALGNASATSASPVVPAHLSALQMSYAKQYAQVMQGHPSGDLFQHQHEGVPPVSDHHIAVELRHRINDGALVDGPIG